MNYKKTWTFIFVIFSSSLSANTCTSDQKHPEGKPENFDINEHLEQFDKAGNAVDKLPGAFGITASASIMASMFASGRIYDLKANPNYMSSQEFGNWFYGAAAAQMGYTRQQSLTAGAIVQQWQNYNNTNHQDTGNVSQLAENLVIALTTGEGDNPDDTRPIEGGHSYSEDIYENDPDKDTNADSCEPQNSNSNSTSGSGYGGGWSFGLFLGAGSCYGNCDVPFGRVIITENPPEEEPPAPEEGQ